jgi:hypothetical protein
MADFVIVAVKYKDRNAFEGAELYSVKVYPFNNTTKKPFDDVPPYEWTRAQLVGAMLEGKKFNTFYYSEEDGKYKLGGKIEMYELNGQRFIKTEANDTPCDNLSNLPEF